MAVRFGQVVEFLLLEVRRLIVMKTLALKLLQAWQLRLALGWLELEEWRPLLVAQLLLVGLSPLLARLVLLGLVILPQMRSAELRWQMTDLMQIRVAQLLLFLITCSHFPLM
jgi:uncharacterized membrane protein YqjE